MLSITDEIADVRKKIDELERSAVILGPLKRYLTALEKAMQDGGQDANKTNTSAVDAQTRDIPENEPRPDLSNEGMAGNA